jgi:nucleotide-binding universal stress UspA family protein
MEEGKLDKILVAVDGSIGSDKAVGLGVVLAREFRASLTLIHVYSLPVYGLGGPVLPPVGSQAQEDFARAQADLIIGRGLSLALKGGVRAGGTLLKSPSIVQTISEFAAREKCDLIVVGTKGMTGLKRLLLGSVASGIVSHAECSVLIAR